MSHIPAVDSAMADSAGAPETEIEITPEMIEAGAEAIALHESGDCDLAAFSCFKAMVAVWRLPHKEGAVPRSENQ
jgi:hypothetical protein